MIFDCKLIFVIFQNLKPQSNHDKRLSKIKYIIIRVLRLFLKCSSIMNDSSYCYG